MSDVVRAVGLQKVYRTGTLEVEVLRGIDCTFQANETVAVVGASGVGKSTLLHVLGTLDRPTGGAVYYGEQDITLLDDRRLAAVRNQHVGFVFQFFHLLPEFTALENVALPALVAGQPLSPARGRAQALLEAVGLGARAAHRPDQLSGGEQQRVAIARALINEPQIVFADEPTGNLDEETSNDVLALLWNLQQARGTTLVVVTHDPDVARRADRTLHLVDGRFVDKD